MGGSDRFKPRFKKNEVGKEIAKAKDMKKWVYMMMLLFECLYAKSQYVQLSPGHQKTVHHQGMIRAAIGNPAIADVQKVRGQDQVLITGKSLGQTSLMVWNKTNEKKTFIIDVVDLSDEKISELLKHVEGVRIQKEGDQTTLAGELYKNSDQEKIAYLKKISSRVVDKTHFNDKALQYLAVQIEKKLHNAGLSSVSAEPHEGQIWLKGHVRSQNQVASATHLARKFFSNIQDQMHVVAPQEGLILVDVKFVEVRKSNFNQFGFEWPASVSASGQMRFQNGQSQTSAIIGQNASLSFQALTEKGIAKVLSNPKLLCKHNTQATFLAGGEIPIRLISERYANVIFKPYGVHLALKPKINGQKVFLEVLIKISDIDPSLSIEGIPAMAEHHIKTALDLHINETVVLGGLFQNHSRKNVRKMPMLGHIPIIGELFKSRAFQNNQSEFFVTLTPMSARPNEAIQKKLGTDVKKIITAHSQGLDYSILD